MKGGIIAAKSVWYIVRTAVIIAAIGVALWFSYKTSSSLANMYIIATDGMKKRAEVVLNATANNDLVEYFTPEFLGSDVLLNSGRYSDYTIKSYEYKIKVESLWTKYWKDTGTLKVTERVMALEGEMLKDKIPEGQEATLPQWEDYEYEITMTKTKSGRYYISKIEKLAKLEPIIDTLIVNES